MSVMEWVGLGIIGVLFLVCLVWFINKSIARAEERFARAKNGELTTADLTTEERKVFIKLRESDQDEAGGVENNRHRADSSNLILWAVLISNRTFLRDETVQGYEGELEQYYPEVYEAYQNYSSTYETNYGSDSSYSGDKVEKS